LSERDDVLASAVPPLAAALTKVRQQLAEAEAAQAVFTVDTRWLAGTRIEASASCCSLP
jgi:hypothetical protein